MLGAGPGTLTVAYDGIAETRSYELYSRSHATGVFGDGLSLHEGEYQAILAETASAVESSLSDIVEGHEGVVMLAPMGAHNAIGVEAWQAVEQWDLQTDDDDVVHAVRYGVPAGDPEHTQTLASLETRVTTAAATDAFAGDRIGNVSGLTQYYRDIGAYGDITPDDGSTATFTPAQPPPVPACANGTAVTSPGVNRGLVHDCEALLAAKDTLRGTATLDWSASTAVTGWAGVTTSGTPSRVTEVELSSEGLSGSIPAGLGTLFELTTLDLSANALTGDIPRGAGVALQPGGDPAVGELADGVRPDRVAGRGDERPEFAQPALLPAAGAGRAHGGDGGGDERAAVVDGVGEHERVPGGIPERRRLDSGRRHDHGDIPYSGRAAVRGRIPVPPERIR